MNITPENVELIAQQYNELLILIKQYLDEVEPDRRKGDLRIDDLGLIEEYINLECHCHPRYGWETRSTLSTFAEWLSKKT